jgi:hypothetical protein
MLSQLYGLHTLSDWVFLDDQLGMMCKEAVLVNYIIFGTEHGRVVNTPLYS